MYSPNNFRMQPSYVLNSSGNENFQAIFRYSVLLDLSNDGGTLKDQAKVLKGKHES